MKISSVLLAFFLILGACTKTAHKQTIGLQLLGDFPKKELAVIKDSIVSTYHCRVVILEKAKVPKNCVTQIKSYRYRADSLLNLLERIRPDSIDIMLGLTSTDIAITKMDPKTGKIKKPASTYTDWAIFGLGRINGVACVVSNKRLKKNASQRKYIKRFTRICNHEIGHVLGLRHCPTKNCLMNDANETIKTIDKSTGELCRVCRGKIN